MNISEQEYYEFVDAVAHEGEPELLFAPLGSLPDDVPPAWADILTGRDWRTGILDLWRPMEDRLPRVCRALQERLQGVGLLRTEDVPASLIYFFSDGNRRFQYRGRPSRTATELVAFHLPPEFLDVYRIHDGWAFHFSGDDGPLPSAEWLPPESVWDELQLKLPPGEIAAGDLRTVFRSGESHLFAFDVSRSPAWPLVVWRDGAVELMADMWAAIDREMGELLEEMDFASRSIAAADSTPRYQSEAATRRDDRLLQDLVEHQPGTLRLEGSFFHRQVYELLLERAWVEMQNQGSKADLLDYYRRALREWCASIESGGETDPWEVMGVFSLAHALRDVASAHFLATMPAPLWGDGSVEAHQLHVLFRLFLNDWPQAEAGLEELLGLTFDGEQPPDGAAEIVARLLESLVRKDRTALAAWRRKAVDKLCSGPGESNARLPWRIRLTAFDAVAC